MEGDFAMAKKTRNLKVCYKSECRRGEGYYETKYIQVPSINLKGKWLEEFGFDIDTPVSVDCEEGRLVITKRG